MKTNKFHSFILTLVMVVSFTTVTAATEFTDVPGSHPYKAAIDFCYEKGIVSGINATTFMPDAKLTRAQFAIIWCRALGIEDTKHSLHCLQREPFILE